MEILQLLSSLLGGEDFKKFEPFFELFKDGSFNLQKILQNLTPEKIEPIFDAFKTQKNRTESVRQNFGLSPISNIADKEVVYCLNKYLSND